MSTRPIDTPDDARAPTSPASTSPHRLLQGLTLQRVAWVTTIAIVVAATTVWFFENDFLDLLVSTLCVGYVTMVLFTVAGNIGVVRRGLVPREAAQVIAVIAGSALGTMLTTVVKGRGLDVMFTERLSGFVATCGLGIGFGSIVVTLYFYRERSARAVAEAARLTAERDADRARAEQQTLSARLQLLQAQVEPHFLFNTLANVQHLVETDPVCASAMLNSLIRYLRAALPRMREQASTLDREIEMVRAYLEIQRVRTGERLAYAIDVDPSLRDAPVPPMMLISLVENAIRHGIDPLPEGGAIRVVATRTARGVSIAVEDTGAGLSEHVPMGIGLANIRERLTTLHGSDAKLTLAENVPRGVIASIELPHVPHVARAATHGMAP